MFYIRKRMSKYMDTLSHYLWAVLLYWYFRKEKKWLIGLSGALPDLMSFGIFILLALITGVSYEPGPPPLEVFPSIIFTMYNITHSFLPIGIVAFFLWKFKPKWWHLSWGWFLHIITDIPTHTREFFPTPILWPLSTITFSGFSWGQWWFMLLNYGLLLIASFYLWKRDSGKS